LPMRIPASRGEGHSVEGLMSLLGLRVRCRSVSLSDERPLGDTFYLATGLHMRR